MPNVAERIREHISLTVGCVDRLCLNAYVPRLQSEGGVIGFLVQRGQKIPSPAVFGQLTATFKADPRAWCQARDIPWLEFRKGERKDDVVEPYRRSFINRTGVVLVGVAQERATGWRGSKHVDGGRVHFEYRRTSVYVAHYYVYFVDEEWRPGFLKVCGYAPYTLKLCLNGHEWAKRQLTKAGVAFTALDNGFERCADPAALQRPGRGRPGRAGPAEPDSRGPARARFAGRPAAGRGPAAGVVRVHPAARWDHQPGRAPAGRPTPRGARRPVHHAPVTAPPPLRLAFEQLDAALDAMLDDARLADLHVAAA